LIGAQAKFPKNYQIVFNLACYESQLGNLKEALHKLEQAIDLAGKTDIRLMALNDPDLKPIWPHIAEI
jgi:catabolite regulation protein CreA